MDAAVTAVQQGGGGGWRGGGWCEGGGRVVGWMLVLST